MRIYSLPVLQTLLPESQWLDWPPDMGNHGVEQDFLMWLWNSEYITDNPDEADWFYWGPFYNRVYLNRPDDNRNDWPEMQRGLDLVLSNPERTFTIAELDPHGLMKQLDLHGIAVFTANRNAEYPAEQRVFDIPLLVHPHALPPRQDKKWLLSFVGHLGTHVLRKHMERQLEGHGDCYVTAEPHGIDDFMRIMCQSYVALVPRGDGAQSFRMYEAMQAGVAPLYISDFDARPFKEWIPWEACSFYWDNVRGLYRAFSLLDRQMILNMGEIAQDIYHNRLAYGKWEEYVVKTLEAL